MEEFVLPRFPKSRQIRRNVRAFTSVRSYGWGASASGTRCWEDGERAPTGTGGLPEHHSSAPPVFAPRDEPLDRRVPEVRGPRGRASRLFYSGYNGENDEVSRVRIAELMSSPVITVEPTTSVADVARTMLDHHLQSLPVVDPSGKVVGIVTETDLVVQNANVHFPTFLQILDGRIYLTNPRAFEEELRRALGTVASDVMTPRPHTARPDDDVSVAATLMVDHKINAIPILEGDRLVGIISRSDVLRHVLAQDTVGNGA